MVTQIQRKEYDAIQKRRGYSSQQANQGFLTWKGPDGKYYKNDQSGIAGTKEMVAYNRGLKKGSIDNQAKLI